MAEEGGTSADDVEAQMLQMMQEEMKGGAEGGEQAAAPEAAAEDATPAGDTAESAPAGDIDSLLEQEMLKAMQDETSIVAPVPASFGVPSAAVSDDYEGIDRLTDVDVEVTVELGDSLIPIQDILTWNSGSVVELTPEEHDPVNVLLNGSVFARGEIVVVGDNFGVRITELIDLPEDARGH